MAGRGGDRFKSQRSAGVLGGKTKTQTTKRKTCPGSEKGGLGVWRFGGLVGVWFGGLAIWGLGVGIWGFGWGLGNWVWGLASKN